MEIEERGGSRYGDQESLRGDRGSRCRDRGSRCGDRGSRCGYRGSLCEHLGLGDCGVKMERPNFCLKRRSIYHTHELRVHLTHTCSWHCWGLHLCGLDSQYYVYECNRVKGYQQVINSESILWFNLSSAQQ